MTEPAAGPFDLATVDRLLSTTRAVRNRLDLSRPVERSIILDCIRLSQQAPTGSNRQGWRWVVVTDAEKRRRIGEIYARAEGVLETLRDRTDEGQTRRVYDGAVSLSKRLGQVPVLVIPCMLQRPGNDFVPVTNATLYGSIFPAVWSFQLALRSRGLGSVLTTLHLQWEAEVAALLGIPDGVLQVGLLPVAYTLGTDFKPAQRPDPETITSFDSWDD
jgi:nitroreductase